MNIYYVCAVLSAFAWAITASLNTTIVRYYGVLATNRWRLAIGSVCLWAITMYAGTYTSLYDPTIIFTAIMSGLIGITLGDTALYAGIKYLGSRRVGVLYTLASPITIIIGFIALNERLSISDLTACLIITTGIIVVLASKDRYQQSNSAMNNVDGNFKLGIIYALIASLGQAIGIIVARPVLDSANIDPVAFSAVRLSSAFIPLLIIRYVYPKYSKPKNPMTKSIFAQISFSAILGLVFGMTLVIFALRGGKASVVTTLSSITPIFVLPIVWYQDKKSPSTNAWIGAFIVVFGTAILSFY